jgi:hypothetical protein
MPNTVEIDISWTEDPSKKYNSLIDIVMKIYDLNDYQKNLLAMCGFIWLFRLSRNHGILY